MAKGYPEIKGDKFYADTMSLLFYEPGLIARAASANERSNSTGIAELDALLAPIVRGAAGTNAQAWTNSSAGPMSNLLNAGRIRVELPIKDFGTLPILDLNPQDKVLHKFVADCKVRF